MLTTRPTQPQRFLKFQQKFQIVRSSLSFQTGQLLRPDPISGLEATKQITVSQWIQYHCRIRGWGLLKCWFLFILSFPARLPQNRYRMICYFWSFLSVCFLASLLACFLAATFCFSCRCGMMRSICITLTHPYPLKFSLSHTRMQASKTVVNANIILSLFCMLPRAGSRVHSTLRGQKTVDLIKTEPNSKKHYQIFCAAYLSIPYYQYWSKNKHSKRKNHSCLGHGLEFHNHATFVFYFQSFILRGR